MGSPSYCLSKIGGDSNDDFSAAKIDWSHQSRKQLSMLKVAIDPNQTKITDYYKLLDKIESLASSSSEYGSIINEVDKIQRERLTMCHPELETEKFGSLFKQLLENITLNANKVPQARRHDHIIKKFSTSLLIYAGPRAYNFLHRNIPDGLTCLRTVQRITRSEYKSMREGEFLFADLLAHLHSSNADKVVAIAEDATRVIARTEYDSETDIIAGFVLPCDTNDLPLCNSFIATSCVYGQGSFKASPSILSCLCWDKQSL